MKPSRLLIPTLIVVLALYLAACKGKEITSAPEKAGSDLIEEHSEVHEDFYLQKADQGIDFTAKGNEPFWSMDIDFDNEIRLQVLGSEPIKVPVPTMTRNAETNATEFEVDNKGELMKVSMYQTACEDNMSGEKFTYRVDVTSPGKLLSGCGKFISEQYLLHNSWVLTHLNGIAPKSNEISREKPRLEINLIDKRVYGHSGCNNFNGPLVLSGNKIDFKSPMAMTKMACPGDLETRFIKALQETDNYILNQDTLT
ncbi:MAG: META domain-containing protein, partial [Cyclobacteriaceae bacterium]